MPEPTLIAVLTTSFLVGLSGAVMPGPLLAYNVRESARLGFWAGPLVSLGHRLLELLVVVLLALGLTRLLHRETAVALVGLAGGGMLVWMAWGMVRHPARGLPEAADSSSIVTRSFHLRPLVGGALVSLSNPYWFLWWLTVGAAFLVWAQGLGVAGVMAFYLGHIASDFSWYSLVAGAISSGRRWIGRKAHQALTVGCGLVLAGMGAWFVWTGVQAVR